MLKAKRMLHLEWPDHTSGVYTLDFNFHLLATFSMILLCLFTSISE